MDTNDGQERNEQALSAGRSWAVQQLELAGEMDVAADLESTIPEAAAAYVALQTGQLPSLFFTALAQRQLELDMSTGFQIGASDVLAETLHGRADGTPLSEANASVLGGHDGKPDALMGQDEVSGSIFLAQFTVEKPSRDDCVAQAARSLREMATRLERGQPDGTLFDQEGNEVGSFGLSDEPS